MCGMGVCVAGGMRAREMATEVGGKFLRSKWMIFNVHGCLKIHHTADMKLH